MKRLLQRFKWYLSLEEYWYYYTMHCYYMDEKPSVRYWLWCQIKYGFYAWFGELICKYRGHDFECEDECGPDSGCMAGTCKRCGYSYHHTLY